MNSVIEKPWGSFEILQSGKGGILFKLNDYNKLCSIF